MSSTVARDYSLVAVPAFLLLTFAITWAAWLAPLPLGGPVFFLGVFAPSLVAIGLTVYAQGQTGVRDPLAGITRWDVGARWYLLAVSYMVGR